MTLGIAEIRKCVRCENPIDYRSKTGFCRNCWRVGSRRFYEKYNTTPVMSLLKADKDTPKELFDAYLTERELDIVKFLTQGLTPKEIACRLKLSVKTIWRELANAESHMITNRYNLVDKARRLGYLR